MPHFLSRIAHAALPLCLILSSQVFAQEPQPAPEDEQVPVEAALVQEGELQPPVGPMRVEVVMPSTLEVSLPPEVLTLLRTIGEAASDPTASQLAERDLDAQQLMAKWTRYIGWISAGGLVASVVGVVLLWKTLKATVQAAEGSAGSAKAALAAAEATEKSAKAGLLSARAADRSARAADKSAQAMLRAALATEKSIGVHQAAERAFLIVHEAGVVANAERAASRQIIPFSYTVKNAGRTIAADLEALVSYALVPPRLPLSVKPLELKDLRLKWTRTTIGKALDSGAMQKVRVSLSVDASDWEKVGTGQLDLLILGVITYRDVFEERRWTSLRHGYGSGSSVLVRAMGAFNYAVGEEFDVTPEQLKNLLEPQSELG